MGTSKIIQDDDVIVLVTIFPDFNIPLADPDLMKALKILVQTLDALYDRGTRQVNLHYQIAWRVRNYNMNLFAPRTNKSIFLTIDTTDKTPECTKIPRNISIDELVSIIPASWVTKHEKLRASTQYLNPTDHFDHHYI